MCITLVHDFHTKTSSVEDVSPGVDHLTLRSDDALVKVEAIKIESHGRNAKSSEPNTNNRPSSKEEMKAT